MFDKLWIYNCSGQKIFSVPRGESIKQIDYFFTSIRNFANDIKDSFHTGTISLEKRTFSIIQVNLDKFFEDAGILWAIRRSHLDDYDNCKEKLTFTFVGMCLEASNTPRDDMIDDLEKIVRVFFKLKIDYSHLISKSLKSGCELSSEQAYQSFLKKIDPYIAIDLSKKIDKSRRI